MNVTLTALLGLTLAQPPAADYYPFNSRNIKLPIEYKKDRKQIRQVLLLVARNQENTWYQEAEVTPDRDAFVYTAKDDGVYWFKMVIVDLQGKKDPPDVTRETPDLKVLVDTVKPVVQFTNVKRNGEEVVVEWKVDEKHPDEAANRVFFRPNGAADGYWQEVSLPPGSKNGVRFPAGTTGPVTLKVTAKDLAGNLGEAVGELPAAGTNNQTSTSLSPASGTTNAGAATPAPPVPAGGPIPPPDFGGPMAPAAPPPTTPPAVASPPANTGPVAPAAPPNPVPTTPTMPAPTPPAPTGPVNAGVVPSPGPAAASTVPTGPPSMPGVTQPIATFDPRNAAGAPVTAMTAAPPAGHPSIVEQPRAQVINLLRFDLNYHVEQRGPSGISRVDLWVTRDDGRSWVWWSQHDGRESALRVNLEHRSNTMPEGLYGFRLVPVSGAGLSEATPVAGDAPDMRVMVDITPPAVKIFPPTADPAVPDAVVLQWEATDKNFGDDPITLEWAEHPAGPWRPVLSGGPELTPVAGGTVTARRMMNTGKYAWRVPPGLPPKVFLKVTATDAAGNSTPQVTREPILIDLTKPRAKISGIGPPITPPQQ